LHFLSCIQNPRCLNHTLGWSGFSRGPFWRVITPDSNGFPTISNCRSIDCLSFMALGLTILTAAPRQLNRQHHVLKRVVSLSKRAPTRQWTCLLESTQRSTVHYTCLLCLPFYSTKPCSCDPMLITDDRFRSLSMITGFID
jgi:hypothetical protein